jgi:hypothetical protein
MTDTAIWCDSKACWVVTATVGPTRLSADAVAQRIEQALFAVVGGHNGVFVAIQNRWGYDQSEAELDPDWHETTGSGQGAA